MDGSTTTIRAAAAQLVASTLDHPAEALEDIHRSIEQAADARVELLVLPECAYPAYYLGSAARYRAANVIDNAALLTDLCAKAKRHSMHLVCGFVEDRGDALANAAAMIDDQGKLVGVYRKTFMWGDDNDVFTPGDQVTSFQTKWGKLGVIICADARAPETVAALAAQGAKLICMPTCWVNVAQVAGEFYNPQPDFMIEARAREFHLPLVCANKFGEETEALGYCGYSLIVDDHGRTLAQAPPDKPALLTAEITIGKPAWARPCAEDRSRLATIDPPILPETPPPSRLTVAAIATSDLLPLNDDIETPDALESLAVAGAEVVATTVQDEDTCEKLSIYARTLGLRLVGYPVRDRVASEVFGTYACIPGDRIASYATARARSLDGAAILFVTNMPDDLATMRSRAAENRVYVVGTSESSAAIIAPSGAVLAIANDDDPLPPMVTVDLQVAADKLVFPNTDIWAQRRVEACKAAFGR